MTVANRKLAQQRAHLETLSATMSSMRGPCATCRWSNGWRCLNPAVARGVPNPVEGEIAWSHPTLTHERKATYPTSDCYGSTTDKRWRGKTLCGPEGKLWEPRTLAQNATKWSLRSLWLIPLLLLGTCAYLQTTPDHYWLCTEGHSGPDGHCWTADDAR